MSDNTTRDQLAADLTAALGDYIVEWCCADHPPVLEGVLEPSIPADRLLAKGWRPPARVIETAEDLDALPNESAIVIDRIAFQKFGGWWHSGREATPLHSEQLIDLYDGATATLLWQPEVNRG